MIFFCFLNYKEPYLNAFKNNFYKINYITLFKYRKIVKISINIIDCDKLI